MAAKTKKVAEPVNNAAAAPAPSEAPAADLSVNDLIAVRNIIDIASQRGAFKGAELEAVGRAFNKLNTFLEAVTPKEETTAPAEA